MDTERGWKVVPSEVPEGADLLGAAVEALGSAASVTEWRVETVMGVGRVAMTEAVMEGLEAGYRRYILGTA